MYTLNRNSLTQEAYKALVQGVQEGLWHDYLPGERGLSEKLGISRLTLRAALRRMEDEGILEVTPGRRRRIRMSIGRTPAPTRRAAIAYLCPEPRLELPGYDFRATSLIESDLHRHEAEFQVVCRPSVFSRSPEIALQNLVQEYAVDCWILQRSTIKTQKWFEINNVPVVLAGSAFAGVQLPHVDLDNAAVCRHAVGRLVATGRRQLCYLADDVIRAGDLRSQEGFLNGLLAAPDADGRIVLTAGTTEAVRQKVSALMASVHPPDGFLVDRSRQAYTVLGHILQSGLKVPGDVSIICRTESVDFPAMVPSIAHYSRNLGNVAKRIAELALKCARGEPVERTGHLLFPDFIPGESL